MGSDIRFCFWSGAEQDTPFSCSWASLLCTKFAKQQEVFLAEHNEAVCLMMPPALFAAISSIAVAPCATAAVRNAATGNHRTYLCRQRCSGFSAAVTAVAVA